MKAFLIVALLSMATASAQTPTPAPIPDVPIPALPKALDGGLEYLHDVEFGKGGNRPLHAEILLPKVRPTQPMPAVIWIHGGGWKGGSQKGNGAGFLAPYGYVAVSIEYRLTTEAMWPAQIEDCKVAVRYLRANAAKYDIDPNRIGVLGHSAGAQLASVLGTMDESAGLEGTGGYPGVSSRVQAVVEMAGPNDFVDFPTWAAPALFGNDKAKDKETLTKASAIFSVKAGDPPFLIVHGDQDKSVSIAISLAFKAALEKAGVPVQMVIVHGGDHGMNAPAGGPPAVPNRAGINALILDFFEKNLKGANLATIH
jgi:acetyl esterase/lipase